ncbi:MAG: response regulator transcription factor [Cyanobacteria bacterium CRU_2_1]|nr:response regulator transcription factor [Cyanobacteria bacterium RU_5_0]NJR60364.1 response regulator transcription factor [Cyanobacteria bacterium CRU_2_1]
MQHPIHVLVVDDHPIVNQGLVALLEYESDITVVGQAYNGREAIELFRQHQPDVTLMDLRMPEMGGVEAITTICAEFSNPQIIVLTTYNGDEDIYRGLRAGAKGYLLKDANPDELLAAIHMVHKGKQYISLEVGIKLAQRMSSPELSERELEVIRLIVKGKTNPEISAVLSITEGTVRFHINNILGKLNVNDRTQAVITALNRGIVSL